MLDDLIYAGYPNPALMEFQAEDMRFLWYRNSRMPVPLTRLQNLEHHLAVTLRAAEVGASPRDWGWTWASTVTRWRTKPSACTPITWNRI